MNRIEQLMVRQEWDSRHEIPALRIATLSVLGIVLAGLFVLLFYLTSPAKALLLGSAVSAAAWPLFALGRRHARSRLLRRPNPGNIEGVPTV